MCQAAAALGHSSQRLYVCLLRGGEEAWCMLLG